MSSSNPLKLAVIPARGGSKRIPRKNIKPFAGRPMIAYAIDAAQASGLFDHVVVSTDDLEIADVARTLGAEVPFRDILTEALPGFAEVGQDPRRPVHPIRLLVEGDDLGRQRVPALLRRRRSHRTASGPVVIAGPAHLQQPSHPADRIGGLLRVHQLVGVYRF